MAGPLVRHLMTEEVVVLRAQQSLPVADELMSLAAARHLPVVDSERRLVGLVTHRDLLGARVSDAADVTSATRDELERHIPVAQIMRRDVWTTSADASALDVAQTLIDHRFGCAPVLDNNRRVIGIITEADFLGLTLRVLRYEQPIEISAIMSGAVITLGPDDDLVVADEVMTQKRIRHLPVIEPGGKFIGLITHRDLLRVQHSTVGDKSGYPEAIKVRDLMHTGVWSVRPDTHALAAASMLADHPYGCLPIVDDDHLVGIVTEADFLELLVRRLARKHARRPRHDVPVNYYMTSPVQTLRPDASLEQAQETLDKLGISSLGVQDEHGDLVGVISRTDLLRVARPQLRLRRPGPALRLPDRRVDQLMYGRPVTVHPEDAITVAAARMFDNKMHRAFVVDSRWVVGVVSTTDLMLAVRDMQLSSALSTWVSSPVFTIGLHESMGKALQILDQASVSGLVVTDDGWPVGVFGQLEALKWKDLPETEPLDHVMSQELVCLPHDMPLHRAAGQAAALHVRRVVAVDGDRVVGVVTGMDFAHACSRGADELEV